MLHARKVLTELHVDCCEDELWTDSLGAKQRGEKIGGLHQHHMELLYHFLKQMIHGGDAEILKFPGRPGEHADVRW
jgi:hypothetical protein